MKEIRPARFIFEPFTASVTNSYPSGARLFISHKIDRFERQTPRFYQYDPTLTGGNEKHVSRNPAQLAVTITASDDLTLVHASKSGDIAAFEELVKRYDRKLFRIAEHLTHNREDAQDVVQEAFLKAFQHLAGFRENSKFSTWLIRITLNQSLMKLRERRVTREVSIDNDFQSEADNLPIEIADWAPNPEELYSAAELREILRKTLQELGPGLRVVFILRDIEGLSLEQTAEVLDLSLSAVKARSRRARLQLRERLSGYFNKAEKFAGVEPRSSHAETRKPLLVLGA